MKPNNQISEPNLQINSIKNPEEICRMKQRSILTVIVFLLLVSSNLSAQTNVHPDVPDVVRKSFNRKFPRAENVAWTKVDTIYKADCFFKGRGTYAEFTQSGKWLTTITDLDLKTLYRPVQLYIDEHFKKDKIIFAEKAENADRSGYYYVLLEKKDPNTKETYEVELFFDKSGKFEQAKYPEGVNDQTIVGMDDPHESIPEEVTNSWKKRYPQASDLKWEQRGDHYFAHFVYREQPVTAEFTSDGEWIEARTSLKEKELHRLVQAYLIEHHKDDDFVLAEKVTRADRQDYTYVKMERFEKGQMRPYVFELYFDRSGKITKVDRPEALKNQYLLTVDIPNDVAKKFKSRFSGASDVTWESDNGNWVCQCIYRGQPTTAIFSDSADWIQTTTELDIKNLYNPVQRYIDENYPNYKVTYAEKVVRADRNNYYYVELLSKKKNLYPPKVTLYFDSAGRLREDMD
ncbi:MAG: hypothetical protein Kow00127_15300 [Bacteroidales bacterium]